MKTDRLLIIFAALMLFVNCNDAPLGHSPYEKEISQRLVEMSLEEKAGQLVQLNIDKICDPNTLELMPDAMEEIFGRYKIGSILNTMGENCPDQEWMRNVMEQIQEYSIKGCGLPCIYGLDMIHGASYLAEGTLFPQEINLGATFNPVHAHNMGKTLAYERCLQKA